MPVDGTSARVAGAQNERVLSVALPYNGMKMVDGTEYRVLVDYRELLRVVDSAMKEGGLLTLPMGLSRPGSPVTINPQQVVSFTDYSGA
jgi:hypothetical protein